MQRSVAEFLGLPSEQIHADYFGPNHRGWMHRLLVDSRDRLPEVLARFEELQAADERWRPFDPASWRPRSPLSPTRAGVPRCHGGRPTGAGGAVLVVHENRGLNDHIRSVAGRLAASGYSALAIDLLSAEGGTAALGDEAAAMAALSSAPQERLVADLRAGPDELERRAPGRKLGAIGFCFGGGMAWHLRRAGPAGERQPRGCRGRAGTGRADPRDRHYPGANHAFFNDTGPRYHPDAAAQAYAKVLDWFGRHLG